MNLRPQPFWPLRRKVLAALGGLATASLAATSPDPWSSVAILDFNAASRAFAAAHAADPRDDDDALCHAAALLVRQPRTRRNIEQADEVLRTVADRTADADRRATAHYLRLRIAHDHLPGADPVALRTAYAELAAAHPAHPLAAHGAVKAALLWVDPALEAPPAEVEHAFATLLAHAHLPAVRRELHFLRGRYRWDRGANAAAALPDLRTARALDFEAPNRNREVDLMIADLARQAGDDALAASHFEAFLAAAPRDTRTATVRRLAEEARARLAARP